MKYIKGIMFDMGGTLIDDVNLSFEDAFNAIYAHFKYKKIDINEYNVFIKDLLKDTLFNRTTFDLKCVDVIKFILDFYDEELDCDLEEIEIIFSNAFSKTELIDGIINVLDECKKKGIKLIVLSNTFLSSKEITRRLDNVGLSKYFDKIIASSDYLVRKPSKLFFEYGLKEIGLHKDEVIYVGNSYTFDVLGSNNALIDCLFINKYHYNEFDFNNLNIKVKEIKDYKEVEGDLLWQIF